MSTTDQAEEKITEMAENSAASKALALFTFNKSNAIIVALVLVIIMLISANIGGNSVEQPAAAANVALPITDPVAPGTTALLTAPVSVRAIPEENIERNGEGRLFYTTIRIPANAETLYLSGSGASANADGSWGDMEAQAINTFGKFKTTLESQGWSMSDIVQVRAFAVAGDYGLLDFDGFNRGYLQFFGTAENPNKPVRSFVQVAALVNENWLVELEVRAARVPP